jgi:hypothetical protein
LERLNDVFGRLGSVFRNVNINVNFNANFNASALHFNLRCCTVWCIIPRKKKPETGFNLEVPNRTVAHLEVLNFIVLDFMVLDSIVAALRRLWTKQALRCTRHRTNIGTEQISARLWQDHVLYYWFVL